MQPRQTSEWDRDGDLQSIRDTYDRYERTGRARLWDEQARGYARLADELQTALVAALVASLPAERPRVLDLGCGDGGLVEALPPRLASEVEWTGVDLRPEPITAARRRYTSAKFLVASADAVPLDTATLDVVVARVLFSSLPSTALESAVATEIRRLLRPGGWVVWLDIRWSNPTNSAVHGLSAARIAGLFPGWTRELRSVGLLPPVARRLGAATPFVYPVLAAFPPLRSHLVGRIRRPAER